ncbi:type II toxin-antitoxin system VapC family toxin [Ornithinimicrobium sufpigmenti]|uniref:type II toxin-antitoxin system VapC family toxin n=1 Tax=Ornithinimicrobium sufpigmenti TaxID=2508882 RepID=UPI001036528E|nr:MULTISPECIES: type II toxin-antitoxin system VapC family toxin [unclassified Ornithinimicrobium]
MAYYLDTSALVKLVAPEPESEALRRWLEARSEALVTSDLARTELFRAVRRVRPELAPLARQVLDTLTVLRLETGVFEEAARLGPPELRSLDAVHLAAALLLEDDLLGVVTYDERLADATRLLGFPVVAPGR